MRNLFLILQILLSVLLTVLIMLQVKGTGFGRVWGGLPSGSSKRGLEGLVFRATFVVAFAFLAISIAVLLI